MYYFLIISVVITTAIPSTVGDVIRQFLFHNKKIKLPFVGWHRDWSSPWNHHHHPTGPLAVSNNTMASSSLAPSFDKKTIFNEASRATALSPSFSPTAAPTYLAANTEEATSVDTITKSNPSTSTTPTYGRISKEEYILTPEQIDTFHREGCVTISNVLTEDEMRELDEPFNRLIHGEISIPGKDFCDMSKPFGIPFDQWSIINCMLPTTYHPAFRNNIYERLTQSMAQQLFPHHHNNNTMTKDYDQLLNKRPGKTDAIFAWHQDMAYWPGPAALNVTCTDTCTFSLAMDDSTPENGCLRYVVGSGRAKTLRPHVPLVKDRDQGHALTLELNEEEDVVQLAPAMRGSITIHDEYVVHGSGGNTCPDKSRRTYVIAYRAKEIVDAERRIGFTHSHNDVVNWDTFLDGEAHRIKQQQEEREREEQEEDANATIDEEATNEGKKTLE